MAIFRNLHTKTGSFRVGNQKLSFDGDFETIDKSVISFLSEKSNWQRLEKEEAKEVAQEEVLEEVVESAESQEDLAKLKEEATALGVKFHHKTGFAKLKELVEEAKK